MTRSSFGWQVVNGKPFFGTRYGGRLYFGSTYLGSNAHE